MRARSTSGSRLFEEAGGIAVAPHGEVVEVSLKSGRPRASAEVALASAGTPESFIVRSAVLRASATWASSAVPAAVTEYWHPR